ncbi:MAG: Rv0909 family putative TA system antitoxin [Gulosibacter sp.]|uniref:Rv0909 family putative TA system antitoxin n=1 Tax=Gulosibacter sp. TaxID=2817531 RepID=UPI003F918131
MADFGNIGDNISNAAKNIDGEQAGEFIDKSSERAKDATGNKYDEQIDGAADKASGFFDKGGQQDDQQR